MAFVNNYVPPPPAGNFEPLLPEDKHWGPEPYDINFAFPIHLKTFESERVKLTPFVPRVHAIEFWKHTGANTHLYRHFPIIYPSLPHFLTWLERDFRPSPDTILFAVIDKTQKDPEHPDWGGSLAGIIGLLELSPSNLKVEIGVAIIIPKFQRTHVASNAAGVLTTYCLQKPTDSPPGLGMRRVQWCASPKNLPSIRLATRLGMKQEGVQRYTWILPEALNRYMVLRTR